MNRSGTFFALLLTLGAPAATQSQAITDTPPADYAIADQIIDDFRLDAHLPGIVYGVVDNGRLVHVGTFGVQDIESARPVTADTLFRIASMTKAFTALTILKLRDEGLLRLDAPAAEYVSEMRSWEYPTDDSPQIRVRDLLNHTGGFVTDDPWGDRQTPLPEEQFTQLLRDGVPFTSAPEMRYEYSNLGYAILGRIITNVSKQPYAATISRTLLQPLGMKASGFVAEDAPRSQRALGYRWEDDGWRLEPTLGPGAFGAMGGLQTNANDYARWVTFLLSAWPPRDGVDNGPVRRATVRELAQGSNFPRLRDRAARTGTAISRQSATYGMGMQVAIDDDLGLTVSHSGGYPGYGSHVLLLPDRGIGIFAFANRTYAGPSVAVWDAAVALNKAGLLGTEHELPDQRGPGNRLSWGWGDVPSGRRRRHPWTTCNEFPARSRRGSVVAGTRKAQGRCRSVRYSRPYHGDWRSFGRLHLALRPWAYPGIFDPRSNASCSDPGVAARASHPVTA